MQNNQQYKAIRIQSEQTYITTQPQNPGISQQEKKIKKISMITQEYNLQQQNLNPQSQQLPPNDNNPQIQINPTPPFITPSNNAEQRQVTQITEIPSNNANQPKKPNIHKSYQPSSNSHQHPQFEPSRNQENAITNKIKVNTLQASHFFSLYLRIILPKMFLKCPNRLWKRNNSMIKLNKQRRMMMKSRIFSPLLNRYDEAQNPFFKTVSLQKVPSGDQGTSLLSVNFNRKSKRQYRVTQSCQICLSLMDESIFSAHCGHSFHQMCLMNYIQYKISVGDLVLKCPNDVCCNFCPLAFFLRENLEIKKDNESLEKYYEFELKNLLVNPKCSKKFSCCPTPDCRYIFVRDTRFKDFTCECCQKTVTRYCLHCKSNAHPNFTCQEFQDSRDPTVPQFIFQFLQKANKLSEEQILQMNCKACAQCGAWVFKTLGCNHMTCRCNYQFCYRCGRKYRDPQCKCPLYDQPQQQQNFL